MTRCYVTDDSINAELKALIGRQCLLFPFTGRTKLISSISVISNQRRRANADVLANMRISPQLWCWTLQPFPPWVNNSIKFRKVGTYQRLPENTETDLTRHTGSCIRVFSASGPDSKNAHITVSQNLNAQLQTNFSTLGSVCQRECNSLYMMPRSHSFWLSVQTRRAPAVETRGSKSETGWLGGCDSSVQTVDELRGRSKVQ